MNNKLVAKRLWYFLAALLIIVICVAFLGIRGLNRGIDFQAGTELTVSFEQTVTKAQLVSALGELGYSSALVSLSSKGYYYVQTRMLTPQETNQIKTDLETRFGTLDMSSDTNPQAVADEQVRNAIIAIVIAVVGMLMYIAFAFRKMPNPFRFGIAAVAGLVFDIVVTLGLYAILGSIFGWAIDLMFVAGVLAVLGYSINNTVVVFDRIRENMSRGISSDMEIVTNYSIIQTLGRSFNSSITSLITLFVLALFVGTAIQNFVVVLIIGVISGAFTSTFLSPELLVAWQKKSWGSLTGSSDKKDLAAARSRN